MFLLFPLEFSTAFCGFLFHLLHPDPNPCKAEVNPRASINPSRYPPSTFMGTGAYSKVQPEHVDILLCLSSLPQNNDKSSETFITFQKKILCLLRPSSFFPSLSVSDLFLFSVVNRRVPFLWSCSLLCQVSLANQPVESSVTELSAYLSRLIFLLWPTILSQETLSESVLMILSYWLLILHCWFSDKCNNFSWCPLSLYHTT